MGGARDVTVARQFFFSFTQGSFWDKGRGTLQGAAVQSAESLVAQQPDGRVNTSAVRRIGDFC